MALGKPLVRFDLAEGRFSAPQASLHARRNNAFDLAEKIIQLWAFGRRRVLLGGARQRALDACTLAARLQQRLFQPGIGEQRNP